MSVDEGSAARAVRILLDAAPDHEPAVGFVWCAYRFICDDRGWTMPDDLAGRYFAHTFGGPQ